MRIASLLLTLTLASSAMAGEVFIPATFRGPGAGGSLWRTEIAVSNISIHTPLPVSTTITLFRDGAEPLSITTPLAQNEVLDVEDALFGWFGIENGGGVVRVSWEEPNARIAAHARVYNVGSAHGEFGQGVPAFRTDRLESDVFLPGLSGVNGNRTNIGITNPHTSYALVWVTLYDTAGLARGAFTVPVPPRSYRQLNDIFSYFNSGPLNAAMVRVTSVDSTIYAYASVVRNDSGDATYIAPAQ
jgi:hypothetical protein